MFLRKNKKKKNLTVPKYIYNDEAFFKRTNPFFLGDVANYLITSNDSGSLCPVHRSHKIKQKEAKRKNAAIV